MMSISSFSAVFNSLLLFSKRAGAPSVFLRVRLLLRRLAVMQRRMTGILRSIRSGSDPIVSGTFRPLVGGASRRRAVGVSREQIVLLLIIRSVRMRKSVVTMVLLLKLTGVVRAVFPALMSVIVSAGCRVSRSTVISRRSGAEMRRTVRIPSNNSWRSLRMMLRTMMMMVASVWIATSVFGARTSRIRVLRMLLVMIRWFRCLFILCWIDWL